MRFEEFADCVKWFHPIDERKESDHIWKVSVNDILKYDDDGSLLSANLDIRNPSGADPFEHLPPDDLLTDILEKEESIFKIVKDIRRELKGGRDS